MRIRIPQSPVSARGGVGESLLHLAFRKKQMRSLQLLLAAGARPEIAVPTGGTGLPLAESPLLHPAAARRDLAYVELLVRAGAEINARSEDSSIPLMRAEPGATKTGLLAGFCWSKGESPRARFRQTTLSDFCAGMA